MADSYVLNLEINGEKVQGTLLSVEKCFDATTKAAEGTQSVFDKIAKSAFQFDNISNAVAKLTKSFDDLMEPGLQLDNAMHQLSAVAGVTGSKLDKIEGYARKAAKAFGGSAADSVEAYQLVLSQLGPAIADTPEALAAMGNAIKTTSKLMGNDTVAAAEVLTTAMNQFQVSLDDPTAASEEMARMMNVMAAAGQAGSAELPAISEALRQAGMMAKTCGVSFEETNAAIQVLDKAGKKGSEGGVALRNVLSTLSQGRFLPKDVQEELAAAGVSIDTLTNQGLSLTDRLRGLGAVTNDTALVAKMFGKENIGAALALISNIDAVDSYTQAVTGSKAAEEMSGIIMGSNIEKMSRFKAKIDDLKITLSNIFGEITPAVSAVGDAIQGVANAAVIYNTFHTFSETALWASIKKRTSETWKTVSATYSAGGALGVFSVMALVARVACNALCAGFRAVSVAIYNIPIIGWVAAGIALIIAGFKLLWEKCEGFRAVLYGVWEVIKNVFSGAWEKVQWFIAAFKVAVQKIKDFFSNLWTGIKERFAKIVDPIVNFFTRIFDKIKEKLEPILRPIRELFATISGWFNKGAQKGRESFAKDQAAKKKDEEEAKKAAAPPTVPGVSQTAVAKATEANVSGFGSASEKIDLNNVKGATSYSAVMTKLAPKAFVGLGGGKQGAASAAASTPAGSAASATPAALPSFLDVQPKEDKVQTLLAQIAGHVSAITNGVASIVKNMAQMAQMTLAGVRSSASSVSGVSRPVIPYATAVSSQGGRTVYFQKFCDRVELNVPQGTTQDQVTTIINELMRRINNAVE